MNKSATSACRLVALTGDQDTACERRQSRTWVLGALAVPNRAACAIGQLVSQRHLPRLVNEVPVRNGNGTRLQRRVTCKEPVS